MSESESYPTPLNCTQHLAALRDDASPGQGPQSSLPQPESSQRSIVGSVLAGNNPGSESQDWFSIRDIIQEKIHKGKLYYLIDWEDDVRTGDPYEPSWEPQENVTEVAKRAWFAKQAYQTSPVVSRVSASDVPAVSWRRWNRLCRDRQALADSSQGSLAHTYTSVRRKEIVVVLPRLVTFDKSEYVPWPASGSESTTVLDQELASFPSIPRQPEAVVVQARNESCYREIPDSQEVSTGTESQSQQRLQASGHSLHKSTVADSQENRSADIRESATLQEYSLNQDVVYNVDIHPQHLFSGQQSLEELEPVSQPISTTATQQAHSPPPPSPPQFLSQIPFDSQIGHLSSQLILESTQPRANTCGGRSGSGSTPAELALYNSQAAQIVPAFSTTLDDLDFQTQCDFDIYGEDDSDIEGVVPETVRRPVPAASLPHQSQAEHNSQDSRKRSPEHILATKRSDRAESSSIETSIAPKVWQTSIQAIIEEVSVQSPEALSEDSAFETALDDMESASAASTPMSARERLRQIRERHLVHTPDRSSVDRGESVAAEQREPTAPLIEDQSNVAALQDANVEPPATAGILSPSLAFETAELLPNDILALDQNVQQSLAPAMELDPGTTFVQRPLPVSGSQERSLALQQQQVHNQTRSYEIHENSLQPIPDVQNVALSDLAIVPEVIPITLNPTSLTLSIEGDFDGSLAGVTSGMAAAPLHHDPLFAPFDSPKDEVEPDAENEYSQEILLEIPTAAHEYVVTLPFFSSARPQYNDIIREHEQSIQQYTSCFSVTPHQQPSAGLIAKIDHMFSRLFDICDYPPFLDTLSSMTAEEITKHVVGTNSKMCFIYELLLVLREAGASKNVVILARPGQTSDILASIVQAGGHNLVSNGQWPQSLDESRGSINVYILSTDCDVPNYPTKPDAYIVYDHTFNHEPIANQDAEPPLVLVLTLVASIQHLNMRVSEKIEPLERKNFLVLAMAKAMRYIEEPEYLPGIDRPHEIAYEFAQHLLNSEYDDFHYEGQQIPDDVFNELQQTSSSQVMQTQQYAQSDDAVSARQSLKRTNNDYEELASKRVRLSQPPLTGLMSSVSAPLRELLGDDPTLAISDDAKVISVSVDLLESLSETIVQLQDELRKSRQHQEEHRQLSDRCQKNLELHVTSIQKIQARFMEATRDRGIFESDCKKAKGEAEKLRSSLEGSRQEASVWREKNHELTEKLKEAHESLDTGGNPELARVSRLESDLSNAREALEKAERRAQSANETAEYSKDVYQEASRTVLELRNENTSLTKKLAELQGRASDNVVAVNKLQAANESKTLLRMIDEQKSIVRDREIEIGRLREELRHRNGRRETRQSSVPRSPRILPGQSAAASSVLMSPARGHSRASGGSNGGGAFTGASLASSRGTSPVPPPNMFDSSGPSSAGGGNGVLFGQAGGGGRYAHLRE